MNLFRSNHVKFYDVGSNASPVPPDMSERRKDFAVTLLKGVYILLARTSRIGHDADIALARDEATRFLPWIIALMVYLAALVLAGSFTLNHTITAGHSARVQTFSVHLPHAADKERDASDKVVALLKGTAGVEDAQLVSSKHIEELVEPWFGKGNIIGSLPLPVIIDAKLKAGDTVDYDALKTKLQAVAPGASIDDHKKWVAQFSTFIKAMQMTLVFIAILIIVTTASIVIFACKTSLKIHRNTVNLLHRLGAFDTYIAAQFQNYAALITLKGSFIGSGIAGITLLALHFTAYHLDSPLFPTFVFSLPHWLILFGLPLIMSALAFLAVRMSVLKSLRRYC